MQFSNLEGGLACELRQAHYAVQKRIGLDSSACSRKHLPIAMYPVTPPPPCYELTMLLKAISAVFEYLDLNKPNKSSIITLRKASLSLFPLPS